MGDIVHRDVALPRNLDDRMAALAAESGKGMNVLITELLERALAAENQALEKEVDRLKRRVRELSFKITGIHRDNARQVRWEMDYLPPPDDEFERG